MLFLFVLPQALAAPTEPVTVATAAHAKATPAARLADALLARGHPPVDHAIVGGAPMEPPTPPGMPSNYRVQFFTVPTPGTEAAFCQRTRIVVRVTKAGEGAHSRIEGSTVLHRLGKPCAGGASTYGEYESKVAKDAIAALDRARTEPRTRIDVQFVDELHENFPDPRISSPLEALRAVPLAEFTWAGPAERAGSLPQEQQLRLRKNPGGQTHVAFYADLWSGVITLSGQRIEQVWLRRAPPAPF